MNDLMSIWRDVLIEHVRRPDLPDFSIRQWAVLITVYKMDGPHTVKGLSFDLNIPKPAISRALDTLSMKKIIKRARDPQDRRTVLVRRTTDGELFIRNFERLLINKSVNINSKRVA